MLTREQFNDCLKAHVHGAQTLMKLGHHKAAVEVVLGVLEATWELTRPDAEWQEADVYEHVPESLRSKVEMLKMVVIIDGQGEPIMGFGRGRNREGNDVRDLTPSELELMNELCDEQLQINFGHLDLSKVRKMEDMAESTPLNPKLVEVTKDQIDREVEKFGSEIDNLFETWGGGEP